MATKRLYLNHKITVFTLSLCLSLNLCLSVTAADLTSALQSKQLSSALDPAAARIRLQVDYAVTMGWQTINYFTAYWAQARRLPSDEELLPFTEALLQQDSDPFIKAVYYIPAQALIIEMHSKPPVESVLQSGLFLYRFDTLSWVFNSTIGNNSKTTRAMTAANSPALSSSFSIKITPYFLDALHSMSIITDYCLSPQGYNAGGIMNDITWCPLWHLYVMSP